MPPREADSREICSHTLRQEQVEKLQANAFDVLVLGGGINGAVSAAALAARGIRVALIDRGDFASFTSMSSSNLAWGGIKYMESYEFALVRKLCGSRNYLLRKYPTRVREVRFLTTVERGFRYSRFFLFLGTLLYWAIGSFFTRRPRLLSKQTIAEEEPMIELANSTGGFEYSDAWFVDNDARFVFGFIREAALRGAVVANYVESLGAEQLPDGQWQVRARDHVDGRDITIRTRVLINACGPYVERHNERVGLDTSYRHLFSKGVHLLVDRITPHERVLTFFADDGRLFFVIPMGDKSSIGTTDTRVDELPPRVTPEDRRFILDNINKRLRLPRPLTEADIIAERCGVRPLAVATSSANAKNADWVSLSRKHVVEADVARSHVSIFGGKLTDCLNVGEEVVEAVQRLGISMSPADSDWYGEPSVAQRFDFMQRAGRRVLAGGDEFAARLWRRYGTDAHAMLDAIEADPRMAEVLIEGTPYTRAEVVHAARCEMIVTLDDFLRRRTEISQTVRREALRRSQGLREACEILFGERAATEWAAYFGAEAETPTTLELDSSGPAGASPPSFV